MHKHHSRLYREPKPKGPLPGPPFMGALSRRPIFPTIEPPPPPSRINIHGLLAAGGLGFVLKFLPSGKWRLENYYIDAFTYFTQTEGMALPSIVTSYHRDWMEQYAHFLGYDTAAISKYPQYMKVTARHTPDLFPSTKLVFGKLPCGPDRIFDPALGSANRLRFNYKNPFDALVAETKEAGLANYIKAVGTWNQVFGKMKIDWTIDKLVHRLCDYLQRSVFRADMTGFKPPAHDPMTDGPRLGPTVPKGLVCDRIFVEFAAAEYGGSEGGAGLRMSICSEFDIKDRSGRSKS